MRSMLSLILLASTAQSLDSRIAAVLPTEGETRWLQIPWRLNLVQARKDAQATGKPMFLWVMNGNPLGST